jgi:acyl-CoA hydrolase
MVALDDEKRPAEVPQLELETDDDHRRHAEALMRREHRKAASASPGASA